MTTDQKQKMRVHIRWMIRRDMAEVLAIAAESFEFPWLEEDFIQCLRQGNCIGMVAVHDERVVGFMVYELNTTRIQVLNFAAAADCRRCGVGSQMAAKLIGKLADQGRTELIIEVRETNMDGQLFFRSQGFRAIATLRNCYDGSDEDAYVFAYRLGNTRDVYAPVNRIAERLNQ
jgi:ribosomal-protein-alanine N-acetyltransferase